MCNSEFSVLVASLHCSIMTARPSELKRTWNCTRCVCFCESRRAYFRLFVQLALERHDFDKRSVGGMTEKQKLEVRLSTLDRFHDESEHRLPIPATLDR